MSSSINFWYTLQFLFFLALLQVTLYPQVNLELRYGGGGDDIATAIELTDDGGYIICGSTTSYGVGNHDIYVIKVDSNLALKWSATYGKFSLDRAHGIKPSNDGGYYLAGFMDGGFGIFDLIVMKIDSIGSLIWSNNFGGSDADELRGISVAHDGGIIVSGYTASFGFGSKDVYLVKFSSEGTKEWEKVIGSSVEDHNYSNIVSSHGNIFLAGFSINGAFWDATITKTDSLGNVLWAKRYGGSGLERIHSILELPDSGLIVVGQSQSFGSGGDDILVIKTDNEGEVLWSKTYGGINNETAYSIVPTIDEGFTIAGYTNSYGFGGYDMFLMHINSTGNLQWFKSYGGNYNDYGIDLKSTSDEGFILAGFSYSGYLGSSDIYVVKMDMNGNSSCPSNTFSPVTTDLMLSSFNLTMFETNGGLVDDPLLATTHPNTLANTLCSIIPVELINFNYSVLDRDVTLSWTTATEKNNQGFKVLRDDEEIGFVPGCGTTAELKYYSYIDENVENGTYLYSLIQIDYDGTTENIGEVEVIINNTPNEYSLIQNYPNPFNPSTIISFTVPERTKVVLKIYDILGKEVAELINDIKSPGRYEVEFISNGLPSGIYFYSFRAGKFTDSKKMILMK